LLWESRITGDIGEDVLVNTVDKTSVIAWASTRVLNNAVWV
jgi:hypothetical protein